MTPRRNLTKAQDAEFRIRGWRTGVTRGVTRVQDAIIWATAAATPSLRDLAREANVSESTISSWRRGTRVPPPDALETLATVLEDRSRLLSGYALFLRKASREMHTEEGRSEWLERDSGEP